MTVTEIFEICGGKDNWSKYYSSFSDCLSKFINDNNLDCSEESFDILKTIADQVIGDYGESWYRRSLGKR